MSRLQKKIIQSDEERSLVLVKRYSRTYHKRLGKYRYIVVFPHLPSVNHEKQVLAFTGEEINGIPYGEFMRMEEKTINGNLLEVDQIPEKIFNLIKRELRNGGYM